MRAAAIESLYDLARSVEATALRLLRERKPDRRLDTNVEFYTALLLHGLGSAADLFTPTFAVGRVARLVGALPRAASRRPADPAAVDLHRPDRSALRARGRDYPES